MYDWQAILYIQAQAVVAEIEGMKAANEALRMTWSNPIYLEHDFIHKADELKELANGMRV